jgi:hypothetical protein
VEGCGVELSALEYQLMTGFVGMFMNLGAPLMEILAEGLKNDQNF